MKALDHAGAILAIISGIFLIHVLLMVALPFISYLF